MHLIKQIFGIFTLSFLIGMFFITDRTPYSDEFVYLGHAYSLYSQGVFGTTNIEKGESKPGARVAPLYPAVLAGLMYIDKGFTESALCHLKIFRGDELNCSNDFSIVKLFQLVLFSLCLGYIWLLLLKIFESKLFAYTTVGLLIFSGTPFYYIDHFLTESLYLAFTFIFLLALAIAIIERKIKYAIISAFFLALAALTRPTFLYLFYILILIFPLVFFFTKNYFSNSRSFINFYIVFIIAFSLISGPWIARNSYHFNKFAITVGYSDKPLATRVAHNEMTNMEYLAGWIYWLPDFGDSLAEKLFGTENIHRLSFSSPESFYPAGRQKVDKRISKAISAGEYKSRMDALLKIYIYPDLINHIKVTLLLAWRGFFVDKYFSLIGLFFLIWAITGGINNKRVHYFHIIFIPTLILLFFQAAISVSIPRYNLILLLPLSIAMASGIIKIISMINKPGKHIKYK